MKNSDTNCEIINLDEYRKKREIEEAMVISDDIARLKGEILHMLEEMESIHGQHMWHSEMRNAAPEIRKLIEMLGSDDEDE